MLTPDEQAAEGEPSSRKLKPTIAASNQAAWGCHRRDIVERDHPAASPASAATAPTRVVLADDQQLVRTRACG